MSATVPQAYEIEMPTGHYVDVSRPYKADIRVEDIAHKLAQTNRFGGGGAYPYSVAQHAVFVSYRLEHRYNPLMCFKGLHHDDAEYVSHDIQKPIKLYLGENKLAELEDSWQEAINDSLRIYVDETDKRIIKDADTYALLLEAWNLLPSRGYGWHSAESQKQWRLNGGTVPKRMRNPSYWRGEITWREARDEFLARHHELKGALDA